MSRHYSGQFVLRIPPALHSLLKTRSQREGISLNQLCTRLLEAGDKNQSAQGGETFSRDLIEVARSLFGKALLGLVLFGSRARGTAQPTSDWDVLIVVSKDTPLKPELYRAWDSEFALQTEKEISPHFCHLPQSSDAAGSLWFEVAIDGILLLDPNRTILKFVQQLRREMAEGLIQRKISHGHPYWVRRHGILSKGA